MVDPNGTVVASTIITAVTTTTTDILEVVMIEDTEDMMTTDTLEEATEIPTMGTLAADMEGMTITDILAADTTNTIPTQDRTIIPEVNLT